MKLLFIKLVLLQLLILSSIGFADDGLWIQGEIKAVTNRGRSASFNFSGIVSFRVKISAPADYEQVKDLLWIVSEMPVTIESPQAFTALQSLSRNASETQLRLDNPVLGFKNSGDLKSIGASTVYVLPKKAKSAS